MSEPDAVEVAVAGLRAGRAVRVGSLVIVSVETATEAMLALIDPEEQAPILLSGERAAALGLGNTRELGPGYAVIVQRCEWMDRALVRSLADPSRDMDRLIPGPLSLAAPEDRNGAEAALTLARMAGLLPALWLVRQDPVLTLTAEQVIEAAAGRRAAIVARARLPVEGLEDTQLVAFRDPGDGNEHVALLVGAPGGKPPLVRLHSECLTGDVFGSLKCDCGPQLRAALQLISEAGGGILLYLRQEGRGIGLANKIRAYALQDRGLDTVDANRRLGFPDDARDYGLAGAMLRALGIESVRLLTNNPSKVKGLEDAGISVVERVAHRMPANPHNADYLAVKQARSGHLF